MKLTYCELSNPKLTQMSGFIATTSSRTMNFNRYVGEVLSVLGYVRTFYCRKLFVVV